MKVILALAALLAIAPVPARSQVLGGRPAGCPHAFCACGAALEVLGRNVRALWSARAWYKFPRSAPSYNAVAVRPHHVFVLKQHLRGSLWLVKDYNSGGHLTRLHARSIAGYTIVRAQ